MNTAEATAWTLVAGPSMTRARWIQQAHVVPAAHESGFRLGAGARALPIVQPPRPYPPPRGQRARAAAEAVVPVTAPLLAHRLVRATRGWSWSPYELIWPTFSAIGQFGLARYRDRLQRRAREQWWARAQEHIASDAAAARATAAIRDSPGHDFKKNLTALAWAGSLEARDACHAQLDHPRQVTAKTEGTTLWHAAMGVPITPVAMGDVWIGAGPCAELQRHIDNVDAELGDRPPHPSLEVADIDGRFVRAEYRGRTITLAGPAPRLDVAFDAVGAAIIVGAGWKLISLAHPTAPAPVLPTITAVVGDLALVINHARAYDDRRPHRLLVATVGAAATSSLVAAGVARAQLPTCDADGEDIMHASGAAFALLGVVGTCRDQLDAHWARALIAAALVPWAAATLIGHRREWTRVAAEGVAMWQAYAASRGLTSSIAAEADHLEVELHQQFQRQLGDARHAAVEAEIDRFRQQVELAERELARLGDDIDPRLATFIAQQCQELREWLERRTQQVAKSSPGG